MTKMPIIVGLDIGTTKIACIAGRKNEYGKLEILGYGRAESNGVEHGLVRNIELTVAAIRSALEMCLEMDTELEVHDVFVGIAGHHIKSLQTRGDMVRKDEEIEITQAEIDELIAAQRKTYIPAGDQIIEVIPQEFSIDNVHSIASPRGYSGVKIGADFHIITGDRNAIRNINRSVERSGLKIKDLMLQPLASAAAVISEEDLEAGVAIVDIGGGTTDLAIFNEGVFRHTAVIPFGGENITNDIKQGLGLLKAVAEQVKVKYGGALSDEADNNLYVSIPGLRGRPAKEISVSSLSKIIQARMSEILEFVNYHIKQVGLDARTLNGGIVLTGGGAQLKHLLQLTEYITGLNARIGLPNEHLAGNHLDEMSKPMYATCIGMILKGYHEFERNMLEQNPDFFKFQTEEENELEVPTAALATETIATEATGNPMPNASKRNRLGRWMDSFKTNIIEMFKEEDEKEL
jgi:cell division protein FtsA